LDQPIRQQRDRPRGHDQDGADGKRPAPGAALPIALLLGLAAPFGLLTRAVVEEGLDLRERRIALTAILVRPRLVPPVLVAAPQDAGELGILPDADFARPVARDVAGQVRVPLGAARFARAVSNHFHFRIRLSWVMSATVSRAARGKLERIVAVRTSRRRVDPPRASAVAAPATS
jgi:hypothetical protein